MASLVKQKERWYAQFYDRTRQPQRKQIPLKTKTKRVARQLLRRLEDAYALGEWDPWIKIEEEPEAKPALSKLGEAIVAFLEAKAHLSPQTVRNYAERLSLFERYLGEAAYLNSISAKDIRGFLNSTNTNAVSRKNYVRHLRVFFRWLIAENAIPADPTEKVRLERVPHKFVRFLSPDELNHLIETIDLDGKSPWLIDVIRVTAFLGLRRAEVCNLRWSHINFRQRTLTVANTETFQTKSRQDRSIPIPDTALAVLRTMYPDRDQQQEDSYVFQHSNGKISEDYLTHRFLKYRRLAGLPENISFHALRHTAASWLVMGGASLEAVRRFLGHSSVQVTQRYTHLAQDAFHSQVNGAMQKVNGEGI